VPRVWRGFKYTTKINSQLEQEHNFSTEKHPQDHQDKRKLISEEESQQFRKEKPTLTVICLPHDAKNPHVADLSAHLPSGGLDCCVKNSGNVKAGRR